MNRRTKLFLNSGIGLLKQLILTVCGFILPRYILVSYGSAVNGLISSMTSFLGFISLLEMGIGPVIQANLYKPLADKDHEQISKIVLSSERFFRRIGYIFIAYIAVLAVLFPTTLNTEFEAPFTISLMLIISISTFAQYFFGATNQLLLNADQKGYIQMLLQIVTVVLNTVICVILMELGCSVHIVKLASALVFVIRPFGQMVYVKKHYAINRKIKLVGEPIKQKWNGFSQHLAYVVGGHVPTFLLTAFSSMENLSVYSVYHLVTNGVGQIVLTAATGLESFFGNILAKNEKEELLKTFSVLETVVHVGVTVLFTITAILIVPFVRVYTLGVTDADYLQPVFAVILVLAYAMQCLRIPYFRIIKAAGHFKQTQNGAFISVLLNVIVSVVLVFVMGLPGVAIGTLVAMLYHTCYFVWYLRKNILCRSAWYFIQYLLLDAVIFVAAWFATAGMHMSSETYGSWVILAIKVSLVTIGVTAVVICLFQWQQVKTLAQKVLKKKTN